MATSTPLLTPEEFQRLYAHQDKAYEYWFGEAVPKAMPTVLHGLTQKNACFLLDDLGYWTSTEVDLHIHPEWQPRPDVLVSDRRFEQPYPTRTDGLSVIEILSPDDCWGMVRQKCKNYVQYTRIETVFLIDPDAREGWFWNAERHNTEPIDTLILPDGPPLSLPALWKRLERQL